MCPIRPILPRGPICLLLAALFVLAASCTESFSDRCRREAREYTERECPRLEHQYVIMDSMTYSDDPQGFTYHYRFTEALLDSDSTVDSELLEQLGEQIRQGLRQNITLKAYKERGFTFTYRYLSARTDSLLLEVSFGPEDYK
jgi:ADP-ribose pyrophosphatase YjhB (NUDIX family)